MTECECAVVGRRPDETREQWEARTAAAVAATAGRFADLKRGRIDSGGWPTRDAAGR